MIGAPLGLLYANAGEWAIHKYVLHGLGRRKGTFWAFHWHEHHRNTRQHDHIDDCYERPVFAWNAQAKEALGLLAAGLVHAPLFPIAPFFTGAVWFSLINYHRVHKRSHQEPGWAREHLAWHYDHHMGPDQDANWCVSWPWFDHIMGTRKPYAGTEREARDRERQAARAAGKAARATAAAA